MVSDGRGLRGNGLKRPESPALRRFGALGRPPADTSLPERRPVRNLPHYCPTNPENHKKCSAYGA